MVEPRGDRGPNDETYNVNGNYGSSDFDGEKYCVNDGNNYYNYGGGDYDKLMRYSLIIRVIM